LGAVGFRPPLAEIAAFLRERNVIFCVDGTQTLGALQLDLSIIRPDVLVVDAYKWMLGPTGSGFLYVAPELRPQLRPSVIGWRSHKTWREVDNLHHGTPEFTDATEKFEGGMLSFGPLYGMEASINLMLELGPERIEQRVMELADQVRAVLRRHGATLLSDEAPYYDSPVIAARLPDRDASALAKALCRDRVIVSARHGYLRVSTHFYNNESDIQSFEQALAAFE
jgi:selenocysteine lyase/cysteine desulfurase